MLAIRMQRTGRKGHAQFRVIVQEARLTPTSGRVVARLGSYDPHTKKAAIDKEKASFYLENGAQPSDRVVSMLTKEGVKLPDWVKPVTKGKRSTKNPDKLRKNRSASAEATADKPAEAAEEKSAESVEEAPIAEKPAEEASAEEKPPESETPAEEKS